MRILAATQPRTSSARSREGRFRQDLYYRLAAFPLRVPPLRERPDDVATLARDVLEDIARRSGRRPWTLSEADLARLRAYAWPGNVRELVHCLERASILSEGEELELDLGDAEGTPQGDAELVTLAEHERRYLRRVLEHTRGRVYGPGGAAEILGLKPSTLQSRMRRLGVERTGAWQY